MKTHRLQNTTAVLGPLMVLLVPKCPLCLLPLVAAFGIAVPSSFTLDAIIAVAVIGWSTLYFMVTPSMLLRVSAVTLAALTICGRMLSIASLTWSSVILMTILALYSAVRCGRCVIPARRAPDARSPAQETLPQSCESAPRHR